MPDTTRRIRLLWDFRGPDAEGTARHFLTHLLTFLSRNELSLKCEVMKNALGGWSVACEAPDLPAFLAETSKQPKLSVADQLGAALKPQRFEWLEV